MILGVARTTSFGVDWLARVGVAHAGMLSVARIDFFASSLLRQWPFDGTRRASIVWRVLWLCMDNWIYHRLKGFTIKREGGKFVLVICKTLSVPRKVKSLFVWTMWRMGTLVNWSKIKIDMWQRKEAKFRKVASKILLLGAHVHWP